jgi:aspartyl-tRNA(Asn)/glutamyl-tRNA(Gln) amidotransferase subunit B
MGHPGVMPVLNIEAMRMGCAVARALNCSIPNQTWFERKQYFYPDMPKNYQISQFASPLGQNGFLEIEGKGIKKRVRIHECHLEEDAGKMIHAGAASLLDYNRAGVSLLEIVTEPDMSCGAEAELFIQQLRRMVRYLGVCDGNMEEGSLRADANISINLPGKGLGRKVEIKNLNSSRFVRLGLDYEALRQASVLDSGGTVTQETRLWNENRDQTEPMRTKENAHDYRYFPEPDLPVFIPDEEFLRSVENALVEPPLNRQKRLMAEYGLAEEAAAAICEEKALADYYEQAAKEARRACAENKAGEKEAAVKTCNWILTDLRHIMSRENIALKDAASLKLSAKNLGALTSYLLCGKVSQKNAKQALEQAVLSGEAPEKIIKEKGWEQINGEKEAAGFVETVLQRENESFVQLKEAALQSNEKRIKALKTFLLGKIIAESKGKLNPSAAAAALEKALFQSLSNTAKN